MTQPIVESHFDFINSTTLKNGAEIIYRNYCSLRDRIIVLAQWNDEFVVWRIDTDGYAHHGRYFDEFDKAYKCFLKETG